MSANLRSFSEISFILAGLWALTILVFSGIPGDSIKLPPIWNADKILHFIIYLILSVFLIYGFINLNKFNSRFKVLLFTVIISSGYGGVIEILQDYVFIGRYGDILDFTANCIGAVIGSLLVFIMKPNYK